MAGDVGFSTAFWRLASQSELRLGRDGELRTTVSVGRDAVEFGLNQYYLMLESFSLIGRLEYAHRLGPMAELNLGLDVMSGLYDISFRGPAPPIRGQPATQPYVTRSVVQDSDHGVGVQPAGYLELELTPDSRTRIVPGLRLDYSSFSEGLDLSPRLSARYRIIDAFPSTTVKAGVGLFHQPPSYIEAVEPLGTPGIRSNRALHYALGLEQELSRQIEIGLEGFFKQLDRLVVPTPSTTGASLEYSNQGQGTVVGAELLAKYKPDDRFFGWLAYTLSRSLERDAPDEPTHLTPFDQTHILTALGSYRLGGGWEFGARFRLVSGNLVTPRVCDFTSGACDPQRLNAVFHAASGAYSSIAFGATNSERLPVFHALDLRVDKHWRFDDWTLSGYLDVQNVYNQQNVEGIVYNYDFTSRQYIAGIPILPSVGLRGEL